MISFGYRLSPEEIHREEIGYLLDDSLYLINEVVKLGVDYIHTFLWGKRAYASKAALGQCKGQSINKVIKSVIDGRALLIGAGDITSADKILEASEYVDLLALASLIIIDPDTKNKISAGKENEITLDVENRIEDLALPKNFPPIVGNGRKWFYSPKNIRFIKKNEINFNTKQGQNSVPVKIILLSSFSFDSFT